MPYRDTSAPTFVTFDLFFTDLPLPHSLYSHHHTTSFTFTLLPTFLLILPSFVPICLPTTTPHLGSALHCFEIFWRMPLPCYWEAWEGWEAACCLHHCRSLVSLASFRWVILILCIMPCPPLHFPVGWDDRLCHVAICPGWDQCPISVCVPHYPCPCPFTFLLTHSHTTLLPFPTCPIPHPTLCVLPLFPLFVLLPHSSQLVG